MPVRVLRTDAPNAGGTWVDEQVFHCPAEGWDLVTSRKPDDLDALLSEAERERLSAHEGNLTTLSWMA